MKKTKMYAKKSLSLFMAVMMLMSAWVWVAPVPEAHAAAETLNYTLEQLYSTYLTEDSGATFVKGKFTNDNTNPAQDGLYANILYSPAYTNGGTSGVATSGKQKLGSDWLGSNEITVYWHHADTVMLYDGKTAPMTGVMVFNDRNGTGTWNGKSTVKGSWLTNNGDDFELTGLWRGACGGNLDFTWAMSSSADPGDTLNYLSTLPDSSKAWTKTENDKDQGHANRIRFKGSMDRNTFLIEYNPGFALYVNDDKTNQTLTATSTSTIRVVNYKSLKDAIAAAKSYIKENIIDNTDYKNVYTAASLAKLAEFANALVAAKPDTTYFNGNSKCDYTGYATDAKTAVDNWYNWGGLEKIHTVTFKKADGTTKSFRYDHNTEITPQLIAKDIPNSIISLDIDYHQLYKWDVPEKPIKVTSDIEYSEVQGDKTQHTNVTYKNIDGKQHEITCPDCKGVYKEDHTAGEYIRTLVEPTCGAGGKAEYACDKECGATVEVALNATGKHTKNEDKYVIRETVDPSCDIDGYHTVEYYCSVCDQLTGNIGTITIDAEGHDYQYNTVAETCTTEGYTTVTCSNCDYKATINKKPALGHFGGDPEVVVIENETASTCEEAGSYDEVVYCQREGCKYEIRRTTIEVEKLGHIEVIDEAVAATCTTDGKTEGKHCERCGKVLVAQTKVDRLGHLPGDKVEEGRVEPNCQNDGYYYEVVYCTREGCGAKLSSEKVTLPKTGDHYYVYTSTGNGTHVGKCTGCGRAPDADIDNGLCSGGTATCTEFAICDKCHGEHGEKLPHNFTKEEATVDYLATAATCTAKATYYYSCKVCGESENDKNHTFESGDKLPHVYDQKVADEKYLATEATCTAKATYYYSCSCGTAFDANNTFEHGEMLPHNFTKQVVHPSYLATSATCTAKATYYYSCEVCGESENDKNNTFESGDKLPHVFDRAVAIEKYLATPATCTSPAKYYYSCACDSSDEEYRSQLKTTFRSGDIAAHDYIELQKEIYAETPATCSDGGKYYKSCSICGNSAKDDAKFPEGADKLFDGQKLSHVNRVERVVTKAPGCNTFGEYYTRETCTRCSLSVDNDEIENRKKIPATGKHSYGDWAVTEATCRDAGERVRTCTTCEGDNKATIKEIIPATGEHTYATDDAGNITWTPDEYNSASCHKEGKAYAACINVIGKDADGNDILCGAKTYKTVAPTGHTWLDPVVDANGEVDFHNDRLKTTATCVAKAVYYKHCSDCGMPLEETNEWGEFDLVNGHNFGGDKKFDAEKQENYYECLNEGCTERRSTPCEFPEITDGISKEDAIALGAVIVAEPDCQTKGSAEVYCNTCGESHKKTIEIAIDPANHISDETITIGAKAATCATDGSTGTKYYACCYTEGEDNSAFIVEEAKVIPADKTLYAHENIVTVNGADATCTTDGYTSYQKCEACGTPITEKVTIPATGHAYTSWTQIEVDGVKNHTRTCENGCGATETVACESDGTANCVETAKCKVCGGAYGDVDATKHKALKIMPEKAPTCQVKGLAEYEYCEACDYTMKDKAQVLDTVDHVYPEAWTQVVTEDENGAKVYSHTKTCINCVEDAENNLRKAVITEACVSDGTANCKQAAKCAACGGTYGEIDPAVHASVETKLVGKRDSTCTVKGYTGDTVYVCCDAVKEQGTELELAAHKFTVKGEVTKAATCMQKGSENYKCENCDEIEPREIPTTLKNHESDKELVIGAREATCTTAGYTGNRYHICCYDLGKSEAQNKRALIAMGKVVDTVGSHKYSNPVPEYMIDEITETTDADGKVTKTITYKTEEPTYDEKVAARRDGKWYHVQQCSECGDILTKACGTSNHTYNCVETSTCDVCSGLCSLIDEDNHKYELLLQPGVSATCVSDGRKDYYECVACGKTYLDKAGRKYIDLTTEDGKVAIKIDKSTAKHDVDRNKATESVLGNCGTGGYELFKCKVEGCTYVARLDTGIVTSNHTWNTTPDGEYVYSPISEPTCGKNGYKAIRCSVCNTIKLNSYVIVPATGEHTYGEPVVIPGEDCKTPGKIIKTCTQCGYKDEQTDTTGVSAHRWSEDGSDGWYVTGGDCSTGVAYERICVVCGTTETKLESSGNHDYQIYERLEPTPESDGYVIYECKNCKFRTDKETLKYEGNTPDTPDIHKHKINYDDYKFISAATCTSAEIREYTCAECFEKVRLPYGEIEPHVWSEQNAEVATCEKDGHNEYYRCVRCRTEYGKVVYPATGHYDNDGDGKCDRCSGAFYGEGNEGGQSTCTCMCHKTGFMGFIYKIARFFWKLFKTNPSCACGNTHY